MILLDTHVLLWLDSGDPRLGAKAREGIEGAHQAGELAVSAISFWEVAMLLDRGRIELAIPTHVWRQNLISLGLREIPIEGAIAITAATLPGFHGDPADRMITATALLRGDTLVTADREILSWDGGVQRLDARR